MFQSLRNRSTNSSNNSQNTGATEEDSFVQVDSVDDEPSLRLNVASRHDTICICNEKNSTQFCATVTAKELHDESARAPVDIVVALDVSGSMDGKKLDLCKTTLTLLLRELSPNDRFGLVTFGSHVNLQIPSRKMTKLNREQAVTKIQSLRTSGCTNMSGGIGMAAKEIKTIESPHKVQTIFLLTDGHANEGVSDKEGIVKLVKGCLGDSKTEKINIPIHCFGYGDDHDQDMLGAIAGATEGGTYYYVDSDTNVSSAFGDALGGVLSVVAQNTMLSIKVPQASSEIGVSILNVYHDKVVRNPDGSHTVTLDDFYAEESRDIVFEVALSKECSLTPVVHVSCTISYLDTINSKLVQSDLVEGIIARPDGNEISVDNQHVAIQWSRVKATELMKESEKLAEMGNLDAARNSIIRFSDEFKQETKDLKSPLINQMLSELDTIAGGLSTPIHYNSHGAKYLQTRVSAHTKQRCAEASEESVNMYRSKKKFAIAKKMKDAMSKSTSK